jgi:hypothetical protein
VINTAGPYRRVLQHVLPLVESVLRDMDASLDEGRSAVQLYEAKRWICAALQPDAVDVDAKGIHVVLTDGSSVCKPWD